MSIYRQGCRRYRRCSGHRECRIHADCLGLRLQEHQRQAAGRTPLRRVGHPGEIAAVIAFLASEDASYISGQTLHVNSGAR